jgi:hypothetical protein
MRYGIFLCAAIAFLATGCTHEAGKPIGGKGGNATIVVYPQHHGATNVLDSMMVYIKYNTLDAPASGKYDDSAFCTIVNSLPVCSFTNLWYGDYYIYGKGNDVAINKKVKGGTPYTIKNQESQNLILAVGEE